jgi:hypothetical protein
MMSKPDPIAEIFSLIQENKKFPSYQTERRIDIFLNLFLEDILSNKIKKKEKNVTIEFIAPEYPLKKKDTNQSTNIDYLCVKKIKEEIKEVILVELKTDFASFNEEQFEIYVDYKENSVWRDSIKEIIQIATSKGMGYYKRIKYFHLLKVLINKRLLKTNNASNLLDHIDEIINNEKKAATEDKPKLKMAFIMNFKKLVGILEHEDLDYPFSIYYVGPLKIKDQKGFDSEKATFFSLLMISSI